MYLWQLHVIDYAKDAPCGASRGTFMHGRKLLQPHVAIAPDRLHQHRPWPPAPATIYINKLYHVVAAATANGQRQRQQNILLLLAMPRNYKQKIRVLSPIAFTTTT
jgi:hypothetical protein